MDLTSTTRGLEDILSKNLTVVFCGINPGLLAMEQGRHFAGRGNRFWRTLHLAGFTPRELRPDEDRSILDFGCGLTAVVPHATARADQLGPADFKAVAESFKCKIESYSPRWLAFLGKAAYAGLTGRKVIDWGLQSQSFGNTGIWVLPNPSGRNLAFNQKRLVDLYQAFHSHVFS